MPFYNYTAIKNGKDVVKGKIEAESIKDARENLRRQNLTPTKIEEQGKTSSKKTAASSSKSGFSLPFLKKKSKTSKIKKLSMREKIDFTNTLFILLRTGIPLVEALLFIEMNTASKKIQTLSSEIRKLIISGSNLSEAVAKYPEVFDQIFAGLIRAGEESGELENTLSRMIYLLDKQDKLRSKVISTLVYPCFIIFLAFAISLIMITFVFPAFKDMYDQIGHSLPLITRIFMDTGVFLKKYWFMLPVILISTGYSIFFVLKMPFTRRILDKVVLDIPVFNSFVRFAYLSNFINILKVAFDAGIPVIDAIILANKVVTNYEIRDAMKDTVAKIQGGMSLSASLKASGIMPGIVMCMISTGEESGQLSTMLEQAVIYIDVQIERLVEIMNKLFEPALLVIIGGVVLTLALALYLPLFQGYQNMV